ncbi:sugar ABC transporter permease [Candidatus Epulonipiscium fishelsonii]|uniref:Sugar ABC transporter permease n=1 Tax=Candidatus Epulonipiscium fishelsonii TaxID=77094 RepID=A0ACC8X9B1_9FIRM|nr:sugar ABC transporter permease [Epulopiscium sp. SCG-B11WGA-EpuloA1]ONI42838.1 sugar ABC transporter permease [Epulopiscium sp. SCG-B05WGA-EpuloA1]
MDIIFQVFPYAIAFTIPLLVTALGGLYSERSGVANIALEGLMIIGAFGSALSLKILPNNMFSVWLSLGVATIAGALFSVLHAFASVNLKANQIISGTAINMMAGALTIFLARNITGSGNIRIPGGFMKVDIPVLSGIPVLGPLFFQNTYYSTWLVLLILILFSFILYKTKFGLRLRACGENPHAADAAGVNVAYMRYWGVLLSGAFSGLGGGIYLVTFSKEFNGGVSGFGFLALAALIFGQWKPLGILGSTFFFGFATTISNVSQVIPELAVIPPMYLKVFPYVVTLLALVIFSKSSQAPRASGEPFDQAKR